ncbi:MAG: Glu/Leu/Phe/Val dehydrogenase dimerization domain-containing protein [Candidatus Acetothermia bacterium]
MKILTASYRGEGRVAPVTMKSSENAMSGPRLSDRIEMDIEAVAQHLDLDWDKKRQLQTPAREIKTLLPVKVAGGRAQSFIANLFQYRENSRYFGYLHTDNSKTLKNTKDLAIWISWKCALLDLPWQGMTGRLCGEIKPLTETDRSAILHSFASRVLAHLPSQVSTILVSDKGLQQHFPKPCEGRNPVITTYSDSFLGLRAKGLAILIKNVIRCEFNRGRQAKIGILGSPEEAQMISEYLRELPEGEENLRLIRSKSKNSYKGLNAELSSRTGLFSVKAEQETAVVEGSGQMLSRPWDVLVLLKPLRTSKKHALQKINARIVIEGGQGLITPYQEMLLKDNNTVVVPDLLATSPEEAVTILAAPTLQRKEATTGIQIIRNIRQTLNRAVKSVWNYRRQHHVSLRMATMAISVGRILDVEPGGRCDKDHYNRNLYQPHSAEKPQKTGTK